LHKKTSIAIYCSSILIINRCVSISSIYVLKGDWSHYYLLYILSIYSWGLSICSRKESIAYIHWVIKCFREVYMITLCISNIVQKFGTRENLNIITSLWVYCASKLFSIVVLKGCLINLNLCLWWNINSASIVCFSILKNTIF
jgi:hypothetical protein